MEAKFSNKVKDVISLAREEALRLGHDYIGTEHLMLGMIRDGEGPGINLLVRSGVSLDQLRQSIEHSTSSTSKSSFDRDSLLNIPLTKQAEKVLRLTYLEAKYFKTNLVEKSTMSTMHMDFTNSVKELGEYNLKSEILKAKKLKEKKAEESIEKWYTRGNYDGNHGGSGWNIDQIVLIEFFNRLINKKL
jgi:ATP-dependent Clp protease ATP-binding subunit ClpC